MKGKQKDSDASRVAMASTKADFRELKTNTNATVQELQEFLRHLKGKSPQEMLGVVASSQLIRATILSCIIVAIAIFALTAIPYFLQGEEQPATQPTAVATPATPAPAPAPTSPPAPEANVTTPDDTPASLKPLGVNETKTAPANSNPLEAKKDDFLKDLE